MAAEEPRPAREEERDEAPSRPGGSPPSGDRKQTDSSAAPAAVARLVPLSRLPVRPHPLPVGGGRSV